MKYFTIPAELTRMEFGDAMIIGNGPTSPLTVGVEVKSLSDLLQSANTGRLAGHQLPGMLSTYDVCTLLYYGVCRPGDHNELQVRRGKLWTNFRIGSRIVPYSYLESFLLDIAATGVRLKHVYDAREAAKWLEVLHRWWSKKWSDHKGLRAFDRSGDLSLMPGMNPDEERLAKVISALPGVGFERACAAAAVIDSIEDLCVTSVEEWESIPGIGKVVAKSIVTAIRQKVRG